MSELYLCLGIISSLSGIAYKGLKSYRETKKPQNLDRRNVVNIINNSGTVNVILPQKGSDVNGISNGLVSDIGDDHDDGLLLDRNF